MSWIISFIELLLCLKTLFFYSIQLSMLKSISTLNVKFLRFQLAKLSISEETNEKEIHFTQTVCNIQLRRQILVFCRLHKHSILVSLSFSLSLSLGLVLYRNASISFRKERFFLKNCLLRMSQSAISMPLGGETDDHHYNPAIRISSGCNYCHIWHLLESINFNTLTNPPLRKSQTFEQGNNLNKWATLCLHCIDKIV